MLAWTVAGVALVVALAALGLARRVSRRLDALGQSYWELRYEYTRLRSELGRLDPGASADAPADPPAATVAFVPLSSIRKKDQ